jgi:hypothetical protein
MGASRLLILDQGLPAEMNAAGPSDEGTSRRTTSKCHSGAPIGMAGRS